MQAIFGCESLCRMKYDLISEFSFDFMLVIKCKCVIV